MRYCGATVDNLLSVDLVTADGRLLTVSADEHPDLFWAVRGGGGNFGVVTSFEYRLHPVGPIIYGGMLIYPVSVVTDLLRFYRDWIIDAPDALNVTVAFLNAPPEPFVPESLQGQPAIGVQVCYVGDLDAGERCLAPLRSAFPPTVELVGPIPYTVHQRINDPGTPWGRQVFLKSANLKEMSRRRRRHHRRSRRPVDVADDAGADQRLGGAISRVAEDATAFGHRDSKFTVYIFTMWPDPTERDVHVRWARAFREALRPHMNGIYVNEMGPEERVHEAYSAATYARLAEVKNAYDPTNFFRMNQNIAPTV